jgi:hypothetical protein
MVIGLVVPDASTNVVPPFMEYWYFVNAGFPPVDSTKYTLIESVVPFVAETLEMDGTEPILFIVGVTFEVGEVHAEPDTAFKATE